MILRFYPTKDATIYERYPQKNTGLDAILDISKALEGSTPYNSRVLVDFDLNTIFSKLAGWGLDSLPRRSTLKMYVSDEQEVPLQYNIDCYAIAQSWNMGIGRYGNIPETTEGVSWYYRNSITDVVSLWPTASFDPNTTGSYQTNPGGGVWSTLVESTQSFNYKVGDLNLDVSPIVDGALEGNFSFYGFLLKKEDAAEASTSTFKSIKFFSKDTHTVYAPVLEVGIEDAVYETSLPVVNTDERFVLNITNLKESYKESSVERIRVSTSPTYPTPVFVTSSGQLDQYVLPEGSQYAVYSAHTDDVIVDFSTYTILSSDNVGNYFTMPFESFQPERYYRFLVKVPNANGIGDQIYDSNWIFKVSRNQ
jgi:hypothetical protein